MPCLNIEESLTSHTLPRKGPQLLFNGWSINTIQLINHYPVGKTVTVDKTSCTMHWIGILPINSAVHPLNNWDQSSTYKVFIEGLPYLCIFLPMGLIINYHVFRAAYYILYYIIILLSLHFAICEFMLLLKSQNYTILELNVHQG